MHRIRTTQLTSMILVSLFSDEDGLSDKAKLWDSFGFKSTENPLFYFLGGTPSIFGTVEHSHSVADLEGAQQASPPLKFDRLCF